MEDPEWVETASSQRHFSDHLLRRLLGNIELDCAVDFHRDSALERNLYGHREARAQLVEAGLIWIEANANRDALNDLSPHNLVGCVLKVATVLEDDGRIVQLSPLQELAYGELDGEVTPRIQALDQFMQGAPIDARLSLVIRREMWEKWVLLAALGAITCLMRGTIGEIEASPGGTGLALQLLDEVVAIIKAVGEPPSEAFVHTARQQLTAKASPLAWSMFRDVQRGRPIEVEQIIGDLVRRGGIANTPMPLLSAAYIHLLVYQKRVAAARPRR